MIEWPFGLPPECNPQLIARIAKYGQRVEIHLLLIDTGPGQQQYVLRDYIVRERRWENEFVFPVEAGQEMAKHLRVKRTPPRIRSSRS